MGIEVTGADDFIVSDHLAGVMMCQVSENGELSAVFGDLIAPEDLELYSKPATDYVEPGVQLDFYTVVEAAVGCRIAAETGDPGAAYGVRLNSEKSRRTTFTDRDKLIVLSES